MSEVRAVDVPELRAELVSYMNGPGVVAFQALMDLGMFPVRPESARSLCDKEAQRLSGDLYFVSDDMASLAKSAANSLPKFTFAPEDLPSPSGFLVFEKPVAVVRQALADDVFLGAPAVEVVASIIAASWSHWSPSPRAKGGAWISWYTDRRAMEDPMGAWPTRFIYDHEFLVPFSDDEIPMMDGSTGAILDGPPGLLSLIQTVWLLMQQPIARNEDVMTYPAARKRLRRMGVEPKPVRVITLRRPSGSGSGASDREYHHQWIVRGHWRQQWYPSREVHRPVWIAPHVKGPEGAPLLGGEKVHAWVR